jgi:hypothetical protein
MPRAILAAARQKRKFFCPDPKPWCSLRRIVLAQNKLMQGRRISNNEVPESRIFTMEHALITTKVIESKSWKPKILPKKAVGRLLALGDKTGPIPVTGQAVPMIPKPVSDPSEAS